jgi:hypothetical protein
MSNESVSITSDVKEKDPRRVAAGKRLGAISKEAKERKRQEREENERLKEKNGGYAVYLIGGVAVVGGTILLLLSKQEQTHEPMSRPEPVRRKIVNNTPKDTKPRFRCDL